MTASTQNRMLVERRIDLGAQVGIARNAAFASGGRTHRLSEMAYNSPRPRYDSPSMTILVDTEQASSK